jgi:hypothetical protein
VQQREQQQRQRGQLAIEAPKIGAEESVGDADTAQYGMREKGM